MDLDRLVDLTPLRPQRQPTEDRPEAPGAAPPQLSVGGGAPPADAAVPPREEQYSYIWGTGIAVEVYREDFRRYLETFEIAAAAAGGSAGAEGSPVGSTHSAFSLLAGAGGGGSAAATAAASPPSAPAGEKYYLREMLRMYLQGRTVLELDFSWLQQAAPALYAQTVFHPTECLQLMTAVAEEVYRDVLQQRHGLAVPEDTMLQVAPKRMPESVTLKNLSPQHVERLLSVRGMVIRVSKIIPEIRVACFQCWNCQYIERSVSGDKGRLFEPTRCAHCGKPYSFRLQHNLSIFEDKQLIKVQESPENVSDGETPVSISVVVYGDMVDAVVPGDRVAVTGIYRAVPIRLNAATRIVKSIFSTHLDGVHIEQMRNTRTAAAAPRVSVAGSNEMAAALAGTAAGAAAEDTARLDLLYSMARRPDIYDILLNSFARTIWGHDDVKRGILSQLFGGTPKKFTFDQRADGGAAARTEVVSDVGHAGVDDPGSSSSNSAFFRSELNVLLCGDPGVAKSQLLSQVHEIAPRGVYTSGKGSSSAGLTASVVPDHDTGELVLEPGALVLSDRGLCCIDEFDKMNEATRSVLHEVMEQQTLSIAKAGIIAQLNARTSILAAANPKESQWNTNLNVVENLQIEPTLLSRFDLIYLLLDRHDPKEDRRLASHVLELYMDTSGGAKNAARARRRRAGSIDVSSDEDEGGSAAAGASTWSEGGTATTVDAVTGAEVPVQLAHDGEVLLQGPAAAPYMPTAVLSEFIAVARDRVFPRLTERSHKALATAFVDLRRARGSQRTVAATLRQLESMIRLAEARARMRYAAEVTVDDVAEAKRLMSAALKESSTDPKTGLISLDMFHAPDLSRSTPESNARRLEELVQTRYIAAHRESTSVAELRGVFGEVMAAANLRPLPPAQFLELLALLAGGDVIKSFTGATVTFGEG